MHVIQSFVFPHSDLPSHERLCVRLERDAWCNLGERRLEFETGGVASSDTFYGGVTIGLWKHRCALGDLRVAFEGSGDFLVAFGVHRLSHGTRWLAESRLELDHGVPVDLPVPGWDGLEDGLLFWRLRSLGRGTITAARWLTTQPPRRDVRLGIVITHFNRQAQARPAIESIREAVLERPDLRGKVTLTVVDNSRNLLVPPTPDVSILPNRNYGGSGGFTRGLLELVDGGRHTHALFMDDDASCEPESIARTHAFMTYVKDPQVAVAGALLSEAEPWFTLEKGARFQGHCKALMAGADMREVKALLWSERGLERPDYGGWWFFAFALADVARWPFPFFVRGDDVLFALSNRFDVVTANGIASYGEDFRAKHGPLTAYLDARYHLLHAFLDERGGRKAIARTFRRLFLRPLLAYHYTSARAVALAMRHIARGPLLFAEQLDAADARAEIASWTPAEKPMPLDRASYAVRAPRAGKEPRLRALARLVTLQGFLLPRAFIRDRVVLQEKGFHGRPSQVFRYRRVLYEHFPSNTGYIAEYDRRRFFRELRRGVAAFVHLLRHARRLQAEHRRGFVEMTSPGFWRSVYADVRVGGPARGHTSPTGDERVAA